MTLLGKGWPVLGSVATRAFPKKRLVGDSSSLKSPVRIAAVGTVPVASVSYRRLTHSSATKKNILLLSVLNLFGI